MFGSVQLSYRGHCLNTLPTRSCSAPVLQPPMQRQLEGRHLSWDVKEDGAYYYLEVIECTKFSKQNLKRSCTC